MCISDHSAFSFSFCLFTYPIYTGYREIFFIQFLIFGLGTIYINFQTVPILLRSSALKTILYLEKEKFAIIIHTSKRRVDSTKQIRLSSYTFKLKRKLQLKRVEFLLIKKKRLSSCTSILNIEYFFKQSSQVSTQLDHYPNLYITQ